uniref:S1 motif domain-containing protein n=1 Tax=Anopheles christyi TaxID=43041 RepID=A0A182K7T8_9DIPT
GNQDGQQPAGKQTLGRESTAQQEATLVVPLGASATANSTDSLLGDNRSVAPPNGQNVVSPSVMAKFLEDELKSSDELLGTPIKHCDTCVCTHSGSVESSRLHESGSLLLADLLGSDQKYYSVATQTLIKGDANNTLLCLRCSSNLNSPSHNNSPYMMKLIKSSDSVISETKSSVSDYLTTPDKVSPTTGGCANGANGSANGPTLPNCDIGTGVAEGDMSEPLALLVATKKDDLMVNPILGHHRLVADRTTSLPSTNPVDQHHHQQQQQQQPLHSKFAGKVPATQQHTKKLALPGDTGFKQSKPPVCGGAGQMTPLLNRPDPTSSMAHQTKLSHDSPSYIIKDTDQMSGSHATPISSTGNGALGQTGKYGTSASGGSMGSGLYHTVGSTNSLWSRTSSKDPEKDGAKMFEIFNRNLIKTIKAENPKMSGPRICALRIQNGSSNILLDNLLDDSLEGLDSKPTTPVMYTRRAKFLDEELLLDDDPSIGLNGAIKTTNLPTATSSADSIPPAGYNKPLVTPNKSSAAGSAVAGSAGDGGTDGHGNLISGTINRVDEGGGGDGAGAGVDDVGTGGSKPVCNMSTTTSPHSSDRLCTIGEEVSNLLINTKLSSAALPKPRLDINVNKLEGIDVTSKKSCTQSSSISGEIDIQESAILRRQQLSRVAEWVQNNSKLGSTEPLSNTESDNEPTASLALTDSLNNNATAPGVPPKASRTSAFAGSKGVGCEGKQTTGRLVHTYGPTVGSNLLNHNGIGTAPHYGSATFAHHASTNVPKPERSAASMKHGYNNNLNSSLNGTTGPSGMLDYNSNATTTVPTGSTLGAIRKAAGTMILRDSALTGQCLIDGEGRLTVEPDPNVPHHEEDDDDDSSSVDLAQMEYNVKQFLLKQNEWSTVHTRRQSLISSSASSVKGRGGEESAVRPVRDPCKGLFPGMAVAQQTTIGPSSYHSLHHTGATPTSGVGGNNNNTYGNSHKYPINPHRTETNL